MKPRAILSVYDKSDLVEFAQGLSELGWELIASGGTAVALRNAGLDILDVSAITGAPEMLGGRVKTLHPAIHGAVLARDTAADRAELTLQGMQPIDLVVCNLYPFQETVADPAITEVDAIEQIDIGGVTLLRAAAKNYARVIVICDPKDYKSLLIELDKKDTITQAFRRQLALKAFAHTRDYDTAIASYFQQLDEEGTPPTRIPLEKPLPEELRLNLVRTQALRYGENPHQAAALYTAIANAGPLGGHLLQGKPLSYNNLLDLDAAWRAASSYSQPAVVIVKHLSPCGVAVAPSIADAFPLALASDPVSAFGGVIAVNRPVDGSFAAALDEADLFIEAIIAPNFIDVAQEWLSEKKKNCRLVIAGEVQDETKIELRSIRGGFLVQELDQGDPEIIDWRVVSQRPPTASEQTALHFAWLTVQHVKSNAIVFATQTTAGRLSTVGIGGGLPSRVDAVRLAVTKASGKAVGAVMASDAFFPFPDGIEAAAKAGITAVVEPGGSVRDEAVIAAADRLGVALVFTGVRHFRH